MAPTPVIVVTGFLGAGKTTLINSLLRGDHGLRIAAIVNDFGAINIDAEILGDAADEVLGLKNGCICCALQGDFLRGLRLMLAQDPAPDLIIVEASGVAEPQGIVEVVQDPMLWGAVSLDLVLGVVDGAAPAQMHDPLWQAQVAQSDLLVVTKADLAVDDMREKLALMARLPVLDARDPLPFDLLLAQPRRAKVPQPKSDHGARFTALEWAAEHPIDRAAFMEILTRTAPQLLRAKGILHFTDRPDRALLLQLAGPRASLTPFSAPTAGCQLVMIGDADSFDREAAKATLDRALRGTYSKLI
ncbi:CobW family GTP-binding protein [Ketogulonicigenium vulgare]|uniref:Cobalamin biosynthesis protein CobW n=1 Tax=Ketogulonicigenium vulgare (strain WSH-001) TaxID=759362 RepID=F9Y618_KETVW|nr:CobW family GTP-binding protein [Ketogulonicigenium vulgare]ADO42651.1 cobalamin biosynthesis protein CobW [Ketogulonicigenium vulgare Y25]AEM40843.1 Cobalamin biosynthesis protein CobW [Ketogulonicigenium vulgare WSH-001]ALJ81006.1 cobalamin biosynthesis protein CobW [Ketogulonicigenium vulgare]ANW33772.1 cobalamin biosynthesis protein CobW [Ketogulonicigenium vulgare]AOZ54561.1 cobalamin biosynthesis protein CobW [Ketogulonicigenium vulgare]